MGCRERKKRRHTVHAYRGQVGEGPAPSRSAWMGRRIGGGADCRGPGWLSGNPDQEGTSPSPTVSIGAQVAFLRLRGCPCQGFRGLSLGSQPGAHTRSVPTALAGDQGFADLEDLGAETAVRLEL